MQQNFTSYYIRVTQTQIKKSVDVESADKGFDLNLPQFGPYTIDYTRNGRFLVLGGRKGHVAAIDWQVRNCLNRNSQIDQICKEKGFNLLY